MTAAELNQLRAQACGIVAALGSTLDSLAVLAQTIENPGDRFCDALVTDRHLDEAALAADTVAALAGDLALAIDRAHTAEQAAVRKLETGGVAP